MAAALLLACGPSCPDGVNCPEGVPPSCGAEWERCRTGYFFAECGDGENTFIACSGLGRCVRFRGGCAAGFQPTACPLDNVCCQELDGAPWPWTDPAPEGCSGCEQQRDAVAAIASLRRATIRLDPGLADTPVDERGISRRHTELSLFVRFDGGGLAFRDAVAVEMLFHEDELDAWVGLESLSDLVGFSPPAACLPPEVSVERAEVVLAAVPPTLDTRGQVHVTFDDGTRVQLDF